MGPEVTKRCIRQRGNIETWTKQKLNSPALIRKNLICPRFFVRPFSRGEISDLHPLIVLYSSYSKEDLGQLTCSYSWSILHFQIQELPKGVVGRLLIEPLALVPGRALHVQMNHGMWVFKQSSPSSLPDKYSKDFQNNSTQRKKEHGTYEKILQH